MNKYASALKGLSNSVEYFTQIAMRRFVLSALERMEKQSISRAKLAESLGASPSYVSRVMRGDVNFTLETMTKLAMATGGRLDVRIVDSYVTTTQSVEFAQVGIRTLLPPRLVSQSNAVTQTLSIDPANEANYQTVGEWGSDRLYGVACG